MRQGEGKATKGGISKGEEWGDKEEGFTYLIYSKAVLLSEVDTIGGGVL